MTDPRTPADPPSPRAPWVAAARQQIGPYLLLQKIGEGGMGEVWQAEQQEPVHRRVALKLIKPGMDSSEVVARFESERQALALMSHPSIASVFDAGTTDGGRPYFVMELVKGLPLTEYCDRQRLGTKQRLELFLRICDGIQHAHHKGVIHRDVKPSNILVYEEDGVATPKIIDFGVAKATQQPLTERTLFTQLGQWVGTPEYMSPEQAEMSSLDIDTRSDVYSLGAVLYELLVGAQIFDAKVVRELGFDEIRRVIRESDPPLPSTRISSLGDSGTHVAVSRGTEPRVLARHLRGDLDWIVMKALEKERSRRYPTPDDLAADVKRHLEHRPVTAGPPSVVYRLGKLVRRHRVGTLAAILIALSMVVGGWGLLRSWAAQREAQIAQRFGQMVAGMEWQLRVSQMTQAHDLTPEVEAFEQRLLTITEEVEEAGRSARGPGEYAMGRGLLALERFEEALEHLDNARDFGLEGPELAYARGVALGVLYDRDYDRARAIRDPERRDEAVAAARQRYRDPALRDLQQAKASSAPLSYVDALVAFYEERLDDTSRHIESAMRDSPWLWEGPSLAGQVHTSQASDHFRNNRPDEAYAAYDAAEQAFSRALEIAPSAAPVHLARCESRVFLLFRSLVQQNPAHTFEALRERAQDACGQLQEVLPNHPDLPTHLANLHLMNARRRNLRGQDPSQEAAIARAQAERGLELRPDSALALRALGDSILIPARHQWEAGKDVREELDEAGRVFQKAMKVDLTLAAANNAANAYLMKARQERDHGVDPRASWALAEDLYREASALHPTDVHVRGNITLVMRDLAEWESDHGIDPIPRFEAAAAITKQLAQEAPGMIFMHVIDAGLATDLAKAQREWQVGDPFTTLERGRASAQRALEISPDTASTYWTLARVEGEMARGQARAGRDPHQAANAAISHLETHDSIFPGQVRAHRLRAQVYNDKARYLIANAGDPSSPIQSAFQQTQVAIDELGSKDPQVFEAQLETWDLRLSALDEEAARRVIEEALVDARSAVEAHPEHAATLLAAATIHARGAHLGKPDHERSAQRARELAQRASSINPRLEGEVEALLGGLA